MAENRIIKQEAIAKSSFIRYNVFLSFCNIIVLSPYFQHFTFTFIRHVFHEMRTPLHVLSTFLNCFHTSFDAKADKDFTELKDNFVEMQYVIDHALGMINDLTFATTFEVG